MTRGTSEVIIERVSTLLIEGAAASVLGFLAHLVSLADDPLHRDGRHLEVLSFTALLAL